MGPPLGLSQRHWGLTTHERFKNLMTGLAAKKTASNISPNFDGLKVSGALPAG
jgi:hypothetical protein